MKNYSFTAISCLFIFLVAVSPVFASEICSMLGGTCRDACGQNEAPEAGAFEDCTEKQQCCVAQESGSGGLLCCIYSFDAKDFGPLNCGLPENNTCLKGTGSPAPCSKVTFCK